MSDLDTSSSTDEGFDVSADLAAAFASQREAAPESAPVAESAPADEAPAGETDAERRARDERGRFAPKTAADAAAAEPQAKAPEAPTEAAPEATTEAVDDGKFAPPPGWSIAAKNAFKDAPLAIKEAVARREEEVNKGLAELRSYKEMKPFAEMARSRGDTLPGLFTKYANAERALAETPVQALLWLCQQSRVDPRQLAAVATGQAPAPQPQQQFRQPVQQAPQIGPQDVAALVERTLQQREVTQTIQGFLSDTQKYPYAENLRPHMAHFLETGQAKSLDQAYEMAAWAHPDIRPMLINKQAPASTPAPVRSATPPAQAASNARQAAKSITGSPLAGASSTPDMSALSLEDQLRAGFRSARA